MSRSRFYAGMRLCNPRRCAYCAGPVPALRPTEARVILGAANDNRRGLDDEDAFLSDLFDGDDIDHDCEEAIDRRDCSCWHGAPDVSGWLPTIADVA